jgi:hypothetical protein
VENSICPVERARIASPGILFCPTDSEMKHLQKLIVAAVLVGLVCVGLWLARPGTPVDPQAPASASTENSAAEQPAPTVANDPTPPAVVESLRPREESHQPAPFASTNSAAPPAASVANSPAPNGNPDAHESPEVVPPEPAASSEETAASANMYAAHAPLREPEVADPDSESNKRVLQTMVAKAIAQPPSPPPGANSQP